MKTLGHFLEEARKKTDKTTVPVAQIPQQYSSSDQGPASPVYEAVEVSTSEYEFSHGKPRGSAGGWMFGKHKSVNFDKHKEGEDYVTIKGVHTYGEAKKKAKAWAAEKGHSLIHVLPESVQLQEMGGDQHYSDTKGAASGGGKATPITSKKLTDDAKAAIRHAFGGLGAKREQVRSIIALAKSDSRNLKEEEDDGVRKQKVMHDGEHVATIHTFRGRAGGWMSGAHNPDGSSASKKYGIGLNDTKREILNKIKQYHKGN